MEFVVFVLYYNDCSSAKPHFKKIYLITHLHNFVCCPHNKADVLFSVHKMPLQRIMESQLFSLVKLHNINKLYKTEGICGVFCSGIDEYLICNENILMTSGSNNAANIKKCQTRSLNSHMRI